MKNFIDSMMAGIVLIKHGKQGDPHRRRIFCDEAVETISWKKVREATARHAPDKSNFNSEPAARHL